MEAALYIVEQMNRMLKAAVPFAPHLKDISPGYFNVVMGGTMNFESAHSLEEMMDIARLTADRAVATPNQGP